MGKRSKNKGQFKKGHAGYGGLRRVKVDNTEGIIQRLDKDMFNKVVKTAPTGLLYGPDADGKQGSAKILRPKGEVRNITDEYLENNTDEVSEMRLVSNMKNIEMWNTVFSQHINLRECDNPHFAIDREIKKGLGWRQSLKCTNCSYKSGLFKLYEEVPSEGRGAKRATCNVGLQVGLQDTPIGNTKARLLIAATNTPPPARNSMQCLSKSVGETITQLNNRDMEERRQEVHRINELRGLSADSPINISVDARYNSNSIKSSTKLGQNASQAIGVAIENQTEQKQILAFHLENKLCWTGTWLRNRGFAVQCPGHTACTATMDEADPLSERNIGQKIGDDLANSDLLVQYVTTDGDGRSAEGIQSALAKKHPTCKVERQADTTHLGQSQFRQTIQAKFSEGMFPGETTEKKKEQQKFLGMDIRNRCHAIMTTMHKMYAGDIHAIARRMPKVVETVLDCYSGDCSGCRYNGVTCGGGHRKNWWNQSMYLWRCGLTHFTINEGDRAVLKAILQLRLGVEALRLTKLNLNTNKNEAINRGLSVSLPKNVNFSRNARARASSTIHRLNNGAGVSLIKKLEAVQSPITKGGQVARCVRHFQTTSRYHMSHARTAVHKIKRKYNKIRQMQQYLRAKYLKRVKPDYEKGQLDPIIIAIDGCRANMGHRYELRKRGPFRIKHSDHPYHKPLHHL